MAGGKISRNRLDLIMELEKIMSCCLNGHSSYARASEALEEPKPTHGYPATFTKRGQQAQSWSVLTGGEIEESVIMGGVYKFGASQIPIYQNLSTLLEYLETHYNLQLPE